MEACWPSLTENCSVISHWYSFPLEGYWLLNCITFYLFSYLESCTLISKRNVPRSFCSWMPESIKSQCFQGSHGASTADCMAAWKWRSFSNLSKWLLLKTLVNYPSVNFMGIILINIGVTPLSHSSKFCFIHSNLLSCFLLKNAAALTCWLFLWISLFLPQPDLAFTSLHVAAVISTAQECLFL